MFTISNDANLWLIHQWGVQKTCNDDLVYCKEDNQTTHTATSKITKDATGFHDRELYKLYGVQYE